MHRRTFLTSALGVAAVGLAGCQSGSEPGSQPTTGDGDSPTATGGDGGSSPTDAGLPDHAALTDIDAQPFLGPPPGEAPGLIVAFEDPSCPTCRMFEQDVVPDIRSKLTSTGMASLVVRGYPVIYPWGEPATRALEAVFDADEAAFWALWAHYFDEQGAFRAAGPDAVFSRTESFLADNTDLDAAAVVDRAEAGDYEAAVQADLDAGKAAGAGSTTPHLFFFKNGEYLTKVRGSVSYPLIESVLDV
jgi:protein-disulfide isomerase